MSVSSTESHLYENHDLVLDAVRDIWPTIKGVDILLFQNDLFYKIRQLEVKVEGLGTARGFLPASFSEMVNDLKINIDSWNSGNEDYDKSWALLLEEVSASAESEEALDEFEDDICGWVQDMIPEEYNFFMAALDEGTLNAEWLGRAQVFFEKAVADSSCAAASAPEPEAEPAPEPPKPKWRSSNTRRRHTGFGLGTNSRRRVRMTRRHAD